MALLFEKPSTRTRVSFEAGIVELGGHPMVLRAGELQLTRGESLRDTALVLSRHVAAIGVRTGDEEQLRGLAEHASVPVVNMLSPLHHPCQALADLMTLREAFGSIEGRVLTYVGDGNNVARSLALVGALAGVEVRVAAPDGFQLEAEAGAKLFDDPGEAVAGADAVYTDVWVSMSDDEASGRAAPRGARALPARRRAARPRRPAGDRAALPARPPGRGDHRGRALRRAPADLGPGGEPPPRAEGAARAARFELEPVGVGRVRRMTPPRRRRSLSPIDALVLTRERIQEVLDDAVERGRMTRDDAAELLAELVRRGRRQTDGLVGTHAGPPGWARRSRSRATRTSRPRRSATGSTGSAASSCVVREHERRNANRKTVLAAVDRKLG